ncbi:hypothetical protein SARC_04791 [Sphaeroforma arctica JP610]|uniref:UNC-50 family protein n=1 Tax=Sphaeroforma arctica JP610 TaxID=667725 RepID=A0A0L0G280_9EUKA|nr:hypothetical protein SARC_04791 [Sphaeroforma arctica JP610]KNC82944.1 hypothetical protein SARC_04791 [Sphaeroforma arctica JP610]|eukprot:XP_014156846.1 hypothetical protein SARC_04791 [Sphaeroforma arctica JP610]
MLPNNMSANRQGNMSGRPSRRHKFIRRLLLFRQMDFELAMWEMLNLCIAPSKVYRNITYHKQTKNQWARDDPAFLVLLAGCLCITSVGFSVYFWFPWWKLLSFALWVILFDCVVIGCIISTAGWHLSNKYLRLETPHTTDEKVEWGYCFDIHCNSFFPLVLILHVLQLVLMPLLNKQTFISVFLADTLYLCAVSSYIYITFLGYSTLPFLGNTVALLFPAVAMLGTYIMCILLQINLTTTVLYMYGIESTGPQ